MSELNIKEMMEQIHIPEEMQEQIITNIRDKMDNEKGRAGKWKRMAAAVSVLVLAAGIVSIPVQAIVKNIVRARMESIPKEEVEDMADMIQEQEILADVFSRSYSDTEKERSKELWKAYEDGMFPEKPIQQVDTPEEAAEGELCYIRAAGEFRLPDREMTDEELLEIIDQQHKMSYAVSQSQAAQEAREEMAADQARLEEQLRKDGGISREKAMEIAMDQMRSEIGDTADEMILDHTILTDTGGRLSYMVVYGHPSESIKYFYEIDASDGSVLSIDRLGTSAPKGALE